MRRLTQFVNQSGEMRPVRAAAAVVLAKGMSLGTFSRPRLLSSAFLFLLLLLLLCALFRAERLRVSICKNMGLCVAVAVAHQEVILREWGGERGGWETVKLSTCMHSQSPTPTPKRRQKEIKNSTHARKA